jgi:hypothetical protein
MQRVRTGLGKLMPLQEEHAIGYAADGKGRAATLVFTSIGAVVPSQICMRRPGSGAAAGGLGRLLASLRSIVFAILADRNASSLIPAWPTGEHSFRKSVRTFHVNSENSFEYSWASILEGIFAACEMRTLESQWCQGRSGGRAQKKRPAFTRNAGLSKRKLAQTYSRTGGHYHRFQRLNDRVRNGNGCGPLDLSTSKAWTILAAGCCSFERRFRRPESRWPSGRPLVLVS